MYIHIHIHMYLKKRYPQRNGRAMSKWHIWFSVSPHYMARAPFFWGWVVSAKVMSIFHGKTKGKPWENGDFLWGVDDFNGLVSGKIYRKPGFSYHEIEGGFRFQFSEQSNVMSDVHRRGTGCWPRPQPQNSHVNRLAQPDKCSRRASPNLARELTKPRTVPSKMTNFV